MSEGGNDADLEFGFHHMVSIPGKLFCCDETGEVEQIEVIDQIVHKTHKDHFEVKTEEQNENAPDTHEMSGGFFLINPEVSNKSETMYLVGEKVLKEFSKEEDQFVTTSEPLHGGNIISTCYNDDYYFTSDSKGECKQWKSESNELVHDYKGLGDKAVCMACTPNGKRLYVADTQGVLYQVETEKKSLEQTYPADEGNPIICMAVSQDNRYLTIAFENGKIKSFTILNQSNKPVLTFYIEHEQTATGRCNSLCTTKAGYLFTGESAGLIKQYSLTHGK